MNYTFKATEVNKSFGALSYTCSEKVGSSQGDSTYILFRSYQRVAQLEITTLHIDNKSGIFFIRLNLHVATRLNQYSLSDVAWVSIHYAYQKQG